MNEGRELSWTSRAGWTVVLTFQMLSLIFEGIGVVKCALFDGAGPFLHSVFLLAAVWYLTAAADERRT